MLETVREFKYEKLTPEEQEKRGILGRLVGTIADFKNPTRNDRFYSEELWDKTFDQPLMKEKLENKLLLGELGHPEGRTEIDMEKVAICLADKPVKCVDGTIKGVFDILNTPNGRILKTLCDYGCKIGVSSRGTGDVTEDFNKGVEEVIPESYDMECWDAVIIPAVKSARPIYMTESLNRSNLKKALTESFNKSSEEDKKVMKETLKDLNLDINQEDEESSTEDNIEIVENQSIAAIDEGANLLNQLKESLQSRQELELKVQELQEKLSVCYAKEVEYEGKLNNYKNTIISLSESAKKTKTLKERVDTLNKQLLDMQSNKDAQEADLNQLKSLNENLRLKIKEEGLSKDNLNESLNNSKSEINNLKNNLKELKESYMEKEKTFKSNIQDLKQDSIIKQRQYSEKLDKANKLVEHYKNIAQTSINKYIQTKATMIGVSPEEIKNKLPESYSFKDIDCVCESLKSYKVNINKLPFQIESNKPIRATITESKKEALKIPSAFDDTVDESLIRLAEGINK